MSKQQTANSKQQTAKIKLSNKLYYGDNLEVLRKFIKDETIDLCYIDPPFNSNRNYSQIYLNQGKEDKAQSHAFIDTWTWDKVAEKGYNEILENEHNRFSTKTVLLIEGFSKVLGNDSLLAYLIHITLRVTEIHRVLKSTGSFYLHCDQTASHYLKIVLDGIFCATGGDFKNEIIWCYTSPSKVSTHFPRKHDAILFYTKSGKSILNFDKIRVPYSKESLARANRNVIKKGGTIFDHVELNENGKIPEDWWADIVPASRKPGEHLGYPTQKPIALLERIIKASSNKGDVILDAYCGCGTTISASEKLGRKWIGIDVTYQSISVILKRFEDSYGKNCLKNIELHGIPQDWESAKALAEKDDDKVRKEFEKWAILFYSNNRARINEKKGGDGGIDGIALIQERNEKSDIENKQIIFSVKSDKVLTPAYVNQLKGKMHDKGVVMGILLCLYEPTKGMLKEAHEMGTYKNSLFNIEFPKLQIVSVKDMFDKNERLNIPVINMIKKAEQKGKDEQGQEKLDL